MTEQATSTPAIHQAMAAILADVRAVPKSARNQAQGFSFRSIDQVMTVLHAAMTKHEVFLLPEVVSHDKAQDGPNTNVDLRVRFRFVASDGSEVAAEVCGEGRDRGDKSTSKAHTMALKTALLQVFMVATEDLEDPDATTVERDEAPAQQPQRSQRQQTTRAAKARENGNGKAKADEPARNGGVPFESAKTWDDGLKLLGKHLSEAGPLAEDKAIAALKIQLPDVARKITPEAARELTGQKLAASLRTIWTHLAPAGDLVSAGR